VTSDVKWSQPLETDYPGTLDSAGSVHGVLNGGDSRLELGNDRASGFGAIGSVTDG
jgi:hypothetical protein